MPQEKSDMCAILRFYGRGENSDSIVESDDFSTMDVPFSCEKCGDAGQQILFIQDEERRFLWTCVNCYRVGDALDFAHRLTGGNGAIDPQRRDKILDDFSKLFEHEKSSTTG